ncbi:MAG: hypothetical protein A2Z08_00500 [Deltaproteobacteria bacterium RBG_16_54_11]|nr:MAG: hypothetical protein A2Z08_00500 [Deltaproteobacteria bacterium RBG_16_54_11]
MKKSKKKRKRLPKKKGGKLNAATPTLRQIHLKAVENFAGFVVETAKPGGIVKVQTRGSLVSDDALFYIYIDQITSIFLKNVFVNTIHQFLVLIHDNLSADIYLNYIPTKVLMMTKRDFKKGEVIRVNDIADISKLSFEGINIRYTDKVIYGFKVRWKFGLFFDLHRDDGLDIEAMQSELGSLYRYLSFQYVYDVLESKPQFDLLIKDGWFPFIEIIGSEFKEVSAAYQNLTDPQSRIEELISKFDQERIARITNKWWKKKLFKDKRDILETGIDSYLRNDSKGFIACIKTLLPEIEGIIRLHYFEETRKGKHIHVPDLIAYIVDKGRIKSGSDLSLFFPRAFFEYLNESIFPKFDLEKGDISLSRHTSSHGVARTEDYTKSRALQLILILDQIYFYI